jgi:hypothetical protein
VRRRHDEFSFHALPFENTRAMVPSILAGKGEILSHQVRRASKDAEFVPVPEEVRS